MSLRSRKLLFPLAAAIPVVAGAIFFIGGFHRPPPTLDEICALARAHRFHDAEARGDAYLRLKPHDSKALLVLAELSLASPSPNPERALALLARVRADSPALAA